MGVVERAMALYYRARRRLSVASPEGGEHECQIVLILLNLHPRHAVLTSLGLQLLAIGEDPSDLSFLDLIRVGAGIVRPEVPREHHSSSALDVRVADEDGADMACIGQVPCNEMR